MGWGGVCIIALSAPGRIWYFATPAQRYQALDTSLRRPDYHLRTLLSCLQPIGNRLETQLLLPSTRGLPLPASSTVPLEAKAMRGTEAYCLRYTLRGGTIRRTFQANANRHTASREGGSITQHGSLGSR